MLILVVVLLVLWAILAVLGFAFPGLLWLGIIAVILFAGTIAVALIRRNTVMKRTRAGAPAKPGTGARGTSAASATKPAAANTTPRADQRAAQKKAPTASAQQNEVVADDSENPSSNLE